MVYLFSYIISVLTLELTVDLFFHHLFSKRNKLSLVITSLLISIIFFLVTLNQNRTVLIFPYHYLIISALVIESFYLVSSKRKLGFEVILLFFLIENIFSLYILDLTGLAWRNTTFFLYWSLLNIPFQVILAMILKYAYGRFAYHLFGSKRTRYLLFMCLCFFLLYQINLMMPDSESTQNQFTRDILADESLMKFSQNDIFQSNKVFLIFMIFIMIVVSFVIIEIKKSRNNKKMHHDKKMMESYIDTLEKMQLDIQKVQHDYKNMLIGINGFIEDEKRIDIHKLKVFLEKNKLIQNNVQIKTGTFAQLKNINSLEIKGLISTKVAQAIQSGIHVSIECQETINIPRVDSLVLARLLGIMMDNALEACKGQNQSEIRLAFLNEQTKTLIILANTCKQKNLNINLISQYGVSDKGNNRGFGLGNLKQLTEDNPNLSLETTCENYWFTQKLLIGK